MVTAHTDMVVRSGCGLVGGGGAHVMHGRSRMAIVALLVPSDPRILHCVFSPTRKTSRSPRANRREVPPASRLGGRAYSFQE